MKLSRAAFALLAGFGLAPLAAAPAGAETVDTTDRAAIEAIVRDYLMANPEVIRDAMAALERKQAEAEDAARAAAIADASDMLFSSPRQVVLGPKDAPITLVEFFDYNCGYCKRALGDMQKILDEEKDVKIVLKEFPILGPGSVEAAKIAVAVNLVAPEKYADFHGALLAIRGQADKGKALDAAEEAGLDRATVEARSDDPEVGKTIEEAYEIASRLGLSGTPTYVIGEEVVFGAVGYDELKDKIAAMRNCGKATC
jgi:Protein-disulfide isomerase